jgi:hypothetical protein
MKPNLTRKVSLLLSVLATAVSPAATLNSGYVVGGFISKMTNKEASPTRGIVRF